MKRLVYVLIGAALGIFSACLMIGKSGPKPQAAARIDTVRIVDTVTLIKPTASLTFITGRRTLRLPLAEKTDSTDSASVVITTEQKVYEGESWRAVVSGLSPSLDTLTFERCTERITAIKSPRHSRWGISLTAGVAFTPHRVEPALSIGLSYTLFSF